MHALLEEKIVSSAPTISGQDILDPSMPHLLRGVPCVSAWSANAKVQLALCNFAGGYKKLPGCQASDKCQELVMLRAGKEGMTGCGVPSQTCFLPVPRSVPPK